MFNPTVLVYFFFLPFLVFVLLLLNILLSPQKPDLQKQTTYESGFEPIKGQTIMVFSIQYYLVGILFLVFDLEIAVIYPLVTSLNTLGMYGYWVSMTFFLLLTVGFAFEIGAGALKFIDNRASITPKKAQTN